MVSTRTGRGRTGIVITARREPRMPATPCPMRGGTSACRLNNRSRSPSWYGHPLHTDRRWASRSTISGATELLIQVTWRRACGRARSKRHRPHGCRRELATAGLQRRGRRVANAGPRWGLLWIFGSGLSVLTNESGVTGNKQGRYRPPQSGRHPGAADPYPAPCSVPVRTPVLRLVHVDDRDDCVNGVPGGIEARIIAGALTLARP